MGEAIVLYPTPAIGHLISMLELAKLILTRHPSLTVHILIAPQPYNAGSTAPYIAAVESESGFVNAAEVEKRVRELMEPESEEGRSIRERILSMKNEAKAALCEGGSSCMALTKLRQSMKL